VTGKGVTNLYGQLTAAERLALIAAASARGDEAERDRLTRSAPKVGYSLPHYFGRAFALQQVALAHLATALDLAAFFARIEAMVADTPPGEEGLPLSHRLRGLYRCYAYLIVTHLEAWGLFGKAIGIDGDALWEYLPGRDTLRLAGEAARASAYSEAEAAAFLSERRGKPVRIITAGDVLAGLQAVFEEEAGRWD
jgi:hypothetical protein